VYEYILIIDDDDDMRELMAQAAQVLGMPIRLASDGGEALVHVKRQAPTLILLDLCMPNVTGWDMLDRIREDPSIDAVPTIVMTTLPVSERLATSLRLPTSHIVQKHRPIADLRKLISDIVKDDMGEDESVA
jgi:CheY-like chemotaxis protein